MVLLNYVLKPLIYFLHERAWYKWIKFGVVTENQKESQKEAIEKSLGDFESTLLTGLPEKTQEKIKRLNYSSKR